MTAGPFTLDEIEGMVYALEQAGLTPQRIRARLAEQGIRWGYQYQGGTGHRARARYLRQIGRVLCACGQGTYQKDDPGTLCTDCLERKWGV